MTVGESFDRVLIVKGLDGRFQIASATALLKAAISSAMASADVFQPRVFLGRLFIKAATSLSQIWLAP